MMKEFFIYSFNAMANQCICTSEQLSFIAKHYPEHYRTPIDILIWLYDVASYNEDLLAEQAVYTGPKSKQKKKQDEEENDEDNEDTVYVKSWKDLKKKPLVKPTFGGPVGKAMSEEDKKKKLEKMNLQKKKEEENKSKKEAAKEKDVSQLTQQEDIVAVDETRQPVSLVFIGHVDAGKSTISG